MYDVNLKPKKKFGSWGWVLFFAVGFFIFFLMVQFLDVLAPPDIVAPTPAVTANEQPVVEGTPFLESYEPVEYGFLETGEEPPFWAMMLDMAWKLILVLLLLFVSIKGLAYLQKRQGTTPVQGSPTIQVLETVGLANGRALHLVVAGDKTMLLGATEHQISFLSEITPADPQDVPETATVSEVIADPPTDSAFDEALTAATWEQVPVVEAETLTPQQTDGDWSAALKSLRSGVRNIRQAIDD